MFRDRRMCSHAAEPAEIAPTNVIELLGAKGILEIFLRKIVEGNPYRL